MVSVECCCTRNNIFGYLKTKKRSMCVRMCVCVCLDCTNVYGLCTDFGSFMLITKKAATPPERGRWEKAVGVCCGAGSNHSTQTFHIWRSSRNFSFRSGHIQHLFCRFSLWGFCNSFNILPNYSCNCPCHQTVPARLQNPATLCSH